ncbi:Alkaline nuclease [Frankliniella fusca]|uniref:Alkaline nuclease n=1 Tax=Frankliniella fusca TaxID=407009 RepID=A0AAE1L635_9NEOP|nr:Alkaline nuclease [Frankliniella fusca]
MESHPFLGASPDFLVGDDGVGEVKCPYTHRDKVIGPQHQEFIVMSKKRPTVMKLKKTHRHYYQVQGQMLVTGKPFCDFVVFTFKDF